MALGDQNNSYHYHISPQPSRLTCGHCGITYDPALNHSCTNVVSPSNTLVSSGNTLYSSCGSGGGSGGFVYASDYSMSDLLEKVDELSKSLDAMARILMALQEQVDALKGS